jgi:hypothetical protein
VKTRIYVVANQALAGSSFLYENASSLKSYQVFAGTTLFKANAADKAVRLPVCVIGPLQDNVFYSVLAVLAELVRLHTKDLNEKSIESIVLICTKDIVDENGMVRFCLFVETKI